MRRCPMRNGRTPTRQPGMPFTRQNTSGRSCAGPRPTREACLGSPVDAYWVQACAQFRGRSSPRSRAFRLKFRRDRRSGLPLENPLVFYPRYLAGIAIKAWRYISFIRQCNAILKEVLNAPDRWTYTDLAITPPKADEFEALDIYHATAGGEAALARRHYHDGIRSRIMPDEAAEMENAN